MPNRTSSEINLGVQAAKVLGQLTGGGGDSQAYRRGVDARLAEDQAARSERQLASQLQTDELQRRKLQMELDAADAQKKVGPRDILKALGVSEQDLLDTEMADASGVPADWVDPTTLSKIRQTNATAAAYKMFGKDINQVANASDVYSNQDLRDSILAGLRKPEDVGRAQAAVAGRGYDPTPGARGSEQRDPPKIQQFKILRELVGVDEAMRRTFPDQDQKTIGATLRALILANTLSPEEAQTAAASFGVDPATLRPVRPAEPAPRPIVTKTPDGPMYDYTRK